MHVPVVDLLVELSPVDSIVNRSVENVVRCWPIALIMTSEVSEVMAEEDVFLLR